MNKLVNLSKKILVIASATAVLSACGTGVNASRPQYTTAIEFSLATTGTLENQTAAPSIGEEIAIIHTNYGDISLRFFPDAAPLAVENFLTHARNGYYDGVIFHRIIPNFMIQGGDPTGTGMGGESIWGHNFEDEVSVSYRHIVGALSMANAGPSTNGSQFFIVQNNQLDPNVEAELNFLLDMQDEVAFEDGSGIIADVWPADVLEFYLNHGGTPHLDLRHTVFGQVFYGMNVVDVIAQVETNSSDRPVNDVIINSITVTIFE